MYSAELTLALALLAGMIGQTIARHMRLPGIVVLLALGVVLGPDLLGLIKPLALGPALHAVVGFSVAVILFEGALNLNLNGLRRQQVTIRRLITIGAVITVAGACVLAHYLMSWPWRQAFLFGTLVMVTGPTVITPLLRRIGVRHHLETILEAEGIFVDGLGAIVAVVALEAATFKYGDRPLLEAGMQLAARLGTGLAIGALAGLVLGWLLQRRRLIPEKFKNVFTLVAVTALFQLSNAFMHEMGIVSVIAAGVVVGNISRSAFREIAGFKEQLSVMLIGLLFVLLAADVRLAKVEELGWAAVGVVLGLILLIRPLMVAVSTIGSELNFRDKVFLSWLAPRGIVAAAIASIFTDSMRQSGHEGGEELRALVFVVIGVTVVVQGLSGRWLAARLGLLRPVRQGWVILSAHPLAQILAALIRDKDEDVLLIDSNPHACAAAQDNGYRVLYGNALEPRTLQRARVDRRRACLATTGNEGINLLFAQTVADESPRPQTAIAVHRYHRGVDEKIAEQFRIAVLFGAARDLDHWLAVFEEEGYRLERWKSGVGTNLHAFASEHSKPELRAVLPMAIQSGEGCQPFTNHAIPDEGQECEVVLAIEHEESDMATKWLHKEGWQRLGRVDEQTLLENFEMT